MPFIELKDVSVRYPLKNNQVHSVFSNLNLEIAQGDLICIIGETGCGKSTLLRLLLGSEMPASGEVTVDGKLIKHPSRDRGYVPQRYSLFPDKTVIRNVAFGPLIENFSIWQPLSPAWRKRRSLVYQESKETLLRVGLHERDFHKYPDQLSGGMQQRVAIAQSLIMHPLILLMDESFSALDPNTRRGMQRLIRLIWQESRTTIVFVTHNLSEAIYLGNRVLQIAKTADGSHSHIALDLEVPKSVHLPDGGVNEDELESVMRRLEAVDLDHRSKNLAGIA